LIVTSGTGLLSPGSLATEKTDPPPNAAFPRVSEQVALSMLSRGVNASVVRLPQVHDPVKQGFVSYVIGVAREKGVSAYVGEGLNRWPAVHRLDAAHLYKLALEKNVAGSKSPEEAAEHFGWLALFAGLDMAASGALTQEWLGWHPTGPGLIADLEQMRYLEA
jgi:hypothetical protein